MGWEGDLKIPWKSEDPGQHPAMAWFWLKNEYGVAASLVSVVLKWTV